MLGIPEAEREKNLSGVGAQYDSEVVYHNIQQDLLDQGVIYTDFETAVREYPDIVRQYFMKCKLMQTISMLPYTMLYGQVVHLYTYQRA